MTSEDPQDADATETSKSAQLAWRVIGLGAGLMAAKQARKALDFGWQRVRGGEPPSNPESPATTWGEAILWSAISGVAVGLARMLGQRAAARAWHKATGKLPPGLEAGPSL